MPRKNPPKSEQRDDFEEECALKDEFGQRFRIDAISRLLHAVALLLQNGDYSALDGTALSAAVFLGRPEISNHLYDRREREFKAMRALKRTMPRLARKARKKSA